MFAPAMDVRCEQCRTEYELDETRIAEAGASVRCTTCGHVFKVQRSRAVTDPAPIERSRGWKLRKPDGNVYELANLPDLQRWIVERRVTRDDEVSISGDAWRALGSMPELASFFEVVEAATHAQTRDDGEPPARPYVRPGSTPSGTWEAGPRALGSAARQAEPAWAASPEAASEEDLDAETLRHVRGSRAPLFVVILLLALLGGGAVWFFAFHRAPKPSEAAAVTPRAPAPKAPPAPLAAPSPAATAAAAPAPSAGPPPSVETPPTPAKTATPAPNAAKAPLAAARPEAKAPPRGAGRDFGSTMKQARRMLDERPRQALALLDEAAKLDPRSPEPDLERGIAYTNLEQWSRAIASFQSALDRRPDFKDAIIGIAEAYRYSGDDKHALMYYRRYLDVAPDGPDAPVAKAQIEKLRSP